MSEFLSEVQQAEVEAKQLVEKAHAKAEQIKADAGRKAREMVKETRDELSKEIEAIRLEAEKVAKDKAKKLTAKTENDAAAIEKLGTSNMPKAVELIIKYVYELGGA